MAHEQPRTKSLDPGGGGGGGGGEEEEEEEDRLLQPATQES
jgi:hypothetical protein